MTAEEAKEFPFWNNILGDTSYAIALRREGWRDASPSKTISVSAQSAA
jgi:hypothetical protein